MKKEKNSSKQSKAGKVVLVPLLSGREAEPAFIERAADKATEVVLLLVIDTAAMSGQFGFAAGEIAQANALMQKVRAAVGKKRKTCEDIIEWGDTLTKVEHLAKLRQVDKVCLVKQDNHFFQRLLKDLKERVQGAKFEIVSLPMEEE